MNSKARPDAIPRYLILVFLLFAIGISGAGYWYYGAQKRHIENDTQAGLSAITDLKVQQIVNWRRERMGDAGLILENSMIARRFQSFLGSPPPASESKQAALKWMQSLRRHYLYKQICFLDRSGTIRISTDAEVPPVAMQTLALANEAVKARRVILSDLQRDEKTSEIYIDLLVPLLMSQGHDTSYVGLLLFRIDPNDFLYPLIQSWPTPSQTSETYLVRRDGDEVLYLNELRRAKHTALSLRLPLSQEQLPAALAVRGREGIVEGDDYRGVSVLAAIRSIPDSPWFLIAKVDLEELYAPIHERAYLVIMSVLVLIALAGGIVAAFFREQRLRYHRNEYKAELERSALVQHYGYLTKYANDIILLLDETGRVVEANDRAAAAYGYACEELIGRHIGALVSSILEPSVETRMGQIEERNGMVFESLQRRRDGTVFPVEISSRLIEVDGKKFYQGIARDITERKRAEEALRESEEKYRMLFDEAPVGIAISTLEGKIIDVNKAQAEMIGYTVEELRGRSVNEYYVYPDKRKEMIELFKKTGKVRDFEMGLRKKDGSIIFELLNLDQVKIRGEDYLIATGRDITDRKRAEERISYQAQLLAIVNDAVVASDAQYRLTAWNAAAESMYGWKAEEVLGRFGLDITRTEYPGVDKAEMLRAIAERGSWCGEATQARKDGTRFPVEVSSVVLRDATGKVTGFVSVNRDITERKRAEEALRYERNLLRTLIDNLPDGIYVKDSECRKTIANPADVRNMGRQSEAEVLGKNDFDLFPKDLAEGFYADDQSVLQTGRPVLDREEYVLDTEGQKRWLSTSKVPLRNDKSQIIGLVGIGRDITEHKRAEAALRNAEAEKETILDNQLEHVIYQDREHRILWPNRAACESAGMTREELVGRHCYEIWPQRRERCEDCPVALAIATGQQQETEKTTPDGRAWFIRGYPVRDVNDEIVGAIEVTQDITERKRAEEVVRESEEKCRNVVERANDGIAIIQDTTIRYVNRGLAEVVGCTVEELLGTPFTAHIDRNDLGKVVDRYRRRLAGEDIAPMYEITARHKDGSKVYLEINAGIITYQGKPAELVIVRNLTERKRAEERLRESEKKYRDLINGMNDTVWVIDFDTTILDVNNAAAKVLGYTREELLSMKIPDIDDSLAPEQIQSLAGSMPRDKIQVFETWHTTKDGRKLPVEVSSSLVSYGGKTAILSIARDIAERKRVEEALRSSEAQLSNALKIAHLGPWEYDVASDTFIFNDHFYAIFRATAEQVGGYTMRSADYAHRFVHPDDAMQVGLEIQKALEATDPRFSRQLEHRIIYADGEIGYITVRFFIVKDEQGRTVKTYGVNQDVTERKRAETALRNEKALMDALMDNIPDSIYFKDRQCRLIRINCKMMQSLKLNEMSQAIGKTDVELYGVEFGQKTLAEDQHLMTSGEAIIGLVESRQLEDGQTNWTSTTKVPLRDESGRIVGLVGITREINELMKMQKERERERNLLRTLIDNIPDYIYVKDTEGRFVVGNMATVRKFEFASEGELVGKTDFDFFPRELAARYYADEQKIIQSGEGYYDDEGPAVDTTKEPASRWLSTTKVPFRDAQGKIIGTVGIGRDITERKRVEERLQLSDQILQRVNALVLVGGANGQVTYVSPSVKKILGYDVAEILGDGWWKVSRDDEEGGKREKDIVARCVRGDMPVSATPYERIVKSRDGVLHHILWQDALGPENSVIGVGHDITERKLLEDQLRQAQKLESLGTLAGGIAHDFNNVLGIILGYTSILGETKVDLKKASLSIAAINKAAQRGTGLVRQLLTFARKTDTLLESVRLNDVILELADMLKVTFPKTIQVSLLLEKEIPPITADANQLHQALLNLSVNARDAMPRGGTLTLTTRAVMGAEVRRRFPEAQREQYVSVSVADTGIGMDVTFLTRVFDPFFTTKEKGQGTGLGLAVVYGVVTSHQGFIDVESQVGHGTTFHLYFPIDELNIQVPLIATEQAQEQIAGGTETLVVVEDEEMLLDLLENILTGKGYRVMTAKDGAEAVEVYAQHKDQIDLVLMDMDLPKLSGVEVLRKLQEIDPKVKVIFASGYIDPHIKSEMLKAGAKLFVQKPYFPREVLRHVRKVIEGDKQL